MQEFLPKFFTRLPFRPLVPMVPLLLVGALSHSAQAQTATFASAVGYSAGASSTPFGVAVADVNGDGKPDIVTANYGSSSAGVQLGTGTGTFGAVSILSTGSGSAPYSVAIADVNGDNKLDIVTSNNGNATAGVLLGTGTGTFGAVTTFSTGTSYRPYGVAVADVNGDSKLDIVTANFGDNSTSVLLGTGTGSFGTATTFSTGANTNPANVAIADMNGDNKLDIVTINNNTNTASVLLGTGTGSFGTATTFGIGASAYGYGVAVADVNGDSKLDIVTANYSSSMVGVLLGTGTGSFGTVTNFSTGSGSRPESIVVADVNGDSRPDIVTSNTGSNAAGVLLGTGTGSFGTVISFGTGSGSNPESIAVADVNGDNKLDMVTANYGNSMASVLLNTTVIPTPPAVTNASRCGAGTVLLQASGAATGSTYRWYTVATGGTAISGATSSSYTTPTLYGTTTYYVSIVDNSGNESSRTAIKATISYSLPPTILAGGPTTFNAGGSVLLTAKPNLALKFDGSSQYINTTLDAQPSALPTATWEAWVYPTRSNYGTRQTIMGIDDGGWDRGVIIEANTVNFAVFTGTSTIWQPTTIDLNTWQHIAVVYTANSITFYKNGVPYTYDTTQGYVQSSTVNKLNIGRNPGFGEYFQGQLDEARIWNYQRTQAQIQAGMFAVPAGTTSGLLGSWSFNEGSGTTATDATGTYPGTVTNGAPYVTPGQTSLNATYAWTPSTGLSSATTQTVTATPSTTTTYTVAVNDNGGCAPTASQTVTVYADLVISTANQSISAGIYNSITVLNGGSATLVGNVTVNSSVNVQSGGTLSDGGNVIGGAGSFSLAAGGTLGIGQANGIAATGSTGTVQLTGTRSFSPDANYVYNGSAVQNTGSGLPSQVRSLSTTNASDVTLSAPVSVAQTLTVGSAGNLQLNGQALTLLSSASGTALVVNSGSGAVLGSTATMQRYLDPSCYNGMGYRHYSAPVSGSTVSDLATTTGFTPVLNSAYNTSTTPGQVTPFPTVFGYDQSLLSTAINNYSAFDKGFFSPSNLSDQLAVGRGYVVQLNAAQLVDFTGQLNTGDKPLTLSRNTDATAPDAGWALVGNPYPAPLDWSQVAPADRAGLDGSVYVVQSTGPYTGSYRTYINNVSTSVTNDPLIGSGQGFFVRVSSGQNSGTLTFRNSQRVTSYATQATVSRTTTDPRPLVRLALRTGAGQADGLAVYAEAGATPGFDAQYDAGKLINSTGLNLASLSAANESLAIDGRPAFTATTVVPLTVGVPAAGTYTLVAVALSNLPTGLDAYLSDAKTGQTIPLSQQTNYNFSVSAAEATAPIGRFTLRFGPVTALATASAMVASEVIIYPNPAHDSFVVQLPAVPGANQVKAQLLNALGQTVRQQSAALPATGTIFTVETEGLATGVYTLRLQAGATTLTKRVIIK